MSRLDDPVEAALAQINYEREEDAGFLGPLNTHKRTSKAIGKMLFGLATAPGSAGYFASEAPKILQAWREDRTARTHEQQIYLLDAVIEKLQMHDAEIAKIEQDQAETSKFVYRLSDIIDNTLSFTGSASSQEKLDFLASIAVSGAIVYSTDPIEQTREFLRITSQLTATDVLVLREIRASQSVFKQWPGQPEQGLGEIQQDWPEVLGRLRAIGISEMSYRSAFVRLQGFGLVERTQPNFGTNAPTDTPYALLELGQVYLRYLNDHNERTTAGG